ncbi:MAG TPA: hypothetical protein DD429_11185 [Clostridiaceae bacterium]|nr:hypothetical protein [Clostridiaceae bacterium]
MWTVVYVAQSKAGANELKNMLNEQGVLIKVHQIGKSKNGDGLFEVLVPEAEVEDARGILEQLGRDF